MTNQYLVQHFTTYEMIPPLLSHLILTASLSYLLLFSFYTQETRVSQK